MRYFKRPGVLSLTLTDTRRRACPFHIPPQAQIAVVNTALTAAGMWLLAIPGIGLLSLFVFLCSFIPIMGCIISTIPIGFVALTEYGFAKLAMSIIMVTLVHFVEVGEPAGSLVVWVNPLAGRRVRGKGRRVPMDSAACKPLAEEIATKRGLTRGSVYQLRPSAGPVNAHV